MQREGSDTTAKRPSNGCCHLHNPPTQPYRSWQPRRAAARYSAGSDGVWRLYRTAETLVTQQRRQLPYPLHNFLIATNSGRQAAFSTSQKANCPLLCVLWTSSQDPPSPARTPSKLPVRSPPSPSLPLQTLPAWTFRPPRSPSQGDTPHCLCPWPQLTRWIWHRGSYSTFLQPSSLLPSSPFLLIKSS